MKIFIDLGHPAHVHYFKNFIEIMQQKGHTFIISAREKEFTQHLLRAYNIPFFSRGKGRKSGLGKIIYLITTVFTFFFKLRKEKIDVFMGFGSPYAAQTAWLLRKPAVILDDTEHANTAHKFYVFFSKYILTPKVFLKDFGLKQIRFNSFMELSYLHPKYFVPDSSVLNDLQISKDEKFVFIRFVSWDANHDWGQSGLDKGTKLELIDFLKNDYRVFISSEAQLPDDLEKFKIKIAPEKIHSVLYFASLYIGEGATMACESAILGTPALYVNSLSMGYVNALAQNKLLYHLNSSEHVLTTVKSIVREENFKANNIARKEQFIAKMDSTTDFLIDFFNEKFL
jgi:predicted glycosyltransferase